MAADPKESRAPGIVLPVLISLGAVMLAGVFAGYNDATVEAGRTPLAPWVGPLVAAAFGIGGLTLYFRRHAGWFRALSPRQHRYWSALGLSAIIGGIIGGWMVLDQETGRDAADLFGSGALSPSFALGASLLWAGGLAVGMILYHRAIDDHEERAWLWAGLAGWYAFIFPAPVWWVLHRAALAPPVDVMPLFLVSLLVNGAVYLWLKFR
ncbi:hypothetical protein [Sphingopyxis flava]|nr:hypothetical protein [Sphingopyxis flava]